MWVKMSERTPPEGIYKVKAEDGNIFTVPRYWDGSRWRSTTGTMLFDRIVEWEEA